MNNTAYDMDYEQAVKSVYPEANCVMVPHIYTVFAYAIHIPKRFLFIKWDEELGCDTIYERLAWRKSYNILRQQGKIK